MKTVAWLLLFGTGAIGAQVLSESSEDIGFGFREVHRDQVNPPGAWEGVGHFALFFYKDIELSQSDTYSIAPSGQFALYQDGPTGNIILFTVATQQKRLALEFSGHLASAFEWSESQNIVKVIFERGKASSISLVEPQPGIQSDNSDAAGAED